MMTTRETATTAPPETDLLDLATEATAAAESLRSAAGLLRGADPGHTAFGAGAPGLLGRRCAAIHQTWSAAIVARCAEAAGQADRFDDAARRLRTAASNYAEAERAVQTEGRRISSARSTTPPTPPSTPAGGS
jgi:hypothetical protein